jgi:hypothetical protein
LDKKIEFQQNVEIWRKNMAETKIKYSLKNCKMRMKSSRVAQHGQNHKMKNCRIQSKRLKSGKPRKGNGHKHYFFIRNNMMLCIVR